jgi:hypothetical protein
MVSPKQFNVPTKIHFASLTDSDLGSVFVDRMVHHSGGASFYFGKSLVAILTASYLMIGPRQVDRSALREEQPFWYDPFETVVKLPAGHPLSSLLKAIA